MQWIAGIWRWWRDEGFQFRQNWRWYLTILAMAVGFVGMLALTTVAFDSTGKRLAREERIAAQLADTKQEVYAAYYDRCLRFGAKREQRCAYIAEGEAESRCPSLDQCEESLGIALQGNEKLENR